MFPRVKDSSLSDSNDGDSEGDDGNQIQKAHIEEIQKIAVQHDDFSISLDYNNQNQN